MYPHLREKKALISAFCIANVDSVYPSDLKYDKPSFTAEVKKMWAPRV